jgi:hypothetical protein
LLEAENALGVLTADQSDADGSGLHVQNLDTNSFKPFAASGIGLNSG